MMTEQRKRRIRQKIQQSRERLMSAHPFFALLLMYVRFVAVRDMKEISTNGCCIYFSADFLERLYPNELDYILCHQVLHIVFGHIWRPNDLAGEDYHFACDIQINLRLTELGFDKERYPHLGAVHRSIPGDRHTELSALTEQQIYELLPYSLYLFDERTRSKFLPDSDCFWSLREDVGLEGELILDLPEMEGMLRAATKKECPSPMEDAALKQLWQARVASAAASLTSDSCQPSTEPDFIKRMVELMKKPTVNWRRVLNEFVQERVCDYSFSPPDRRFSGTEFLLPDFNEKDFHVKNILFMVDTSGSIEDSDLAAVYSEIQGAIEQFGGKLMGQLGFFDTEVTPPLPFEAVTDLLQIVPYGGGGTDFRAVFEYIERNCAADPPASIVIFTDGIGPYPKESAAMGIPVLWILNNQEESPPWGKTVRVPPKNIGGAQDKVLGPRAL